MAAPALFPFITLRQERSGALVFNPFLSEERELDAVGALVAERCTGAFGLDCIVDACRTRLGLDREEARRRVQETLAELNRIAAIRYVERDQAAPADPAPLQPWPASSSAALSAPKNVIWDVTYACNLDCPHCLTASGKQRTTELDTAGAHALIDELASAKVLYLSLSGGEPFLRPDLIELLTHIATTNMRVDIATNGTCLPDRILHALRELPVFQVQVSIDGIGAEHDRFRGREGAFASACETLRRLKAEGLATSISSTATAWNIEQLPEVIDLAIELGCTAYKAIPFIPAGRGEANEGSLHLGREGSLRLCRLLTEAGRKYQGRLRVSMETTFAFLLDPPIPTTAGAEGPMICSAGYDTLSVGADGTAYPCPFLHSFPLGNLLDRSLGSIWHESPVLAEIRTLDKPAMSGSCASCQFAPLHCRGGCRASAYHHCGSLRGTDPLCFKDLVLTDPATPR
jgi:mycofactocin biosynthetic radical S-adenosylmethionine protein MftC